VFGVVTVNKTQSQWQIRGHGLITVNKTELRNRLINVNEVEAIIL
jgi:hypothetical protein